MKKNIWLWTFLSVLLLSGCTEEKIEKWSDDNAYAWFSEENVDFTFRTRPDVKEGETVLVGIPFKVAALPSAQDRTLDVSVSRQPTDSRTKYEMQTPVVLHAGNDVDTLWVKVTRSSHLDAVHDTISFKINPSQDFKPGLKDHLTTNLCLYNGFAKPSWWTGRYDADFYIGYFSQTKMSVYYAVTGGTKDPRGSNNNWYNNMEVTYIVQKCNDYITEHNITYPEGDGGEPGTAPQFSAWSY